MVWDLDAALSSWLWAKYSFYLFPSSLSLFVFTFLPEEAITARTDICLQLQTAWWLQGLGRSHCHPGPVLLVLVALVGSVGLGAAGSVVTLIPWPRKPANPALALVLKFR